MVFPEINLASVPQSLSIDDVTPQEWSNAARQALNEQPAALDVQVGGDHYKNFAIQPVTFIHANNIGFLEGNAIKYLCRWRAKAGVQDLEKARHYIDLLIELEKKSGL